MIEYAILIVMVIFAIGFARLWFIEQKEKAKEKRSASAKGDRTRMKYYGASRIRRALYVIQPIAHHLNAERTSIQAHQLPSGKPLDLTRGGLRETAQPCEFLFHRLKLTLAGH